MEPPGLTSLLDKYLVVRKKENVAILYDSERTEVRRILEDGLKRRGHPHKSVPLEHRSGSYTTDALWLLENPEYPVVILTSVRSIWHHPARKRAKYELGKRMASVICEAPGFMAGYTCEDPEKMKMLGEPISKLMVKGAKVKLATLEGTNVEAIVEIPFFESGVFATRATGGNWPSGEIGFGPKEGSVNGTIVYDVKFKHFGSMETRKAIVRIEEDRCVRFDGPGGQDLKKLFIGRDKALMYVGEVAMGLNSGFEKRENGSIVVDPDPRTIVEEKALGTAHFGHGGNLSFGKRTGDHADGVISCPSISIDGIEIMKEGKFLPGPFPDDVCDWLAQKGMLLD